jgi:hypothetical protein
VSTPYAYKPCPDCGANADELHVCDPDRFVNFQMLLLRPGIVGFEDDLESWLKTVQGRFAVFYAGLRRG